MPRRPAAPPDRLARVLAHVSADEVVSLAQRLVRVPSVFRPEDAAANETAVARVIAEWLGAEGFELLVEEVAPGRPNVVATLAGGAAGPTLVLEGHTDVVTEGDRSAWRHDPWSGVVDDGRLYGRGAADMKGGLAAAMVAAAALRRAEVRFAGRLVVAALVDEETGMTGARHFVRTPIGRAMDAAIVCEPEQNELCLEQKGVMWIAVALRGRMAHGAMPYAGANPLAAAAVLLAALPALERRLAGGVPRSRALGRPHVTPTCLAAPLDGAAQRNVIPGEAEVTLDVRLPPGLEPAVVLDAVAALGRRIETRHPGVRVEPRVLDSPRPPTRVAPDARVVEALAWAVRAVTGRRARFGGVPGSTDGTIFVMERGIPIVTFGPGDREVPHQVDEHVPVSQLFEAASCYAAAALRFFGAA